MPDLDPAAVTDLEALCEHAARIIRETRPLTVEAALPQRTAALDAISARLVQAGVEERIALNTVTRWFITKRPIAACLEIEADPPYDSGRAVPGVAQTHAPGTPRPGG